MKKILILLSVLFLLITHKGMSQNNCIAQFTYDSLIPNSSINFYDQSMSYDSSFVEITSWNWTFTQYGIIQTSNLQNPTIIFNDSGEVNVCLEIITSDFCTSNHCETLFIGNIPCNIQITGTISPDNGSCNGSITTTVNGGTPPYFYDWSNNATTPYIDNLCFGQYSVIVTDQNQCSATATFYLNDSTNNQICLPSFIYQGFQNGVHYFFDNSSVSSNITNWDWSFGNLFNSNMQNPEISDSLYGSLPICLTITTSENVSCTYCETIVFNTNNACSFTVDMNITPISTINGNDGSINLTVTGGIPPYQFVWSNGAQTEDISGLTAGTYTVQVFDADSNCLGMTYTASIFSPNDTLNGGSIIDTLYSSIIDTCLSFTPNSFYVSQVEIINNTTILVTWVFENNGVTETIQVEYQFSQYGNHLIILTINCDDKKNLASYISYININQSLSILDFENQKIKYYPNPANEYFTIEAKTPYVLQLFDINGRVLVFENVQEEIHLVNLKNIPSGLYFIKVRHKNQSSINKLIILEK